jgi:hypothetical protein
MKKSELQQIIREEISKVLNENNNKMEDNTFKRMQKLAGLIKESTIIDKLNLGDKYIPSFKISQQLESNPEEIYAYYTQAPLVDY